MKNDSKQFFSGFTLIELLIVIAIIGILAGAILLSTTKARTNAMSASTKEVLLGLRRAIAFCCTSTNNSINQWNGVAPAQQRICSDGTGDFYPTADKLHATGVYYTSMPCWGVGANAPAIGAHIWGHPKAACNETATATHAAYTALTVGVNYFRLDEKGIDRAKLSAGC